MNDNKTLTFDAISSLRMARRQLDSGIAYLKEHPDTFNDVSELVELVCDLQDRISEGIAVFRRARKNKKAED